MSISLKDIKFGEEHKGLKIVGSHFLYKSGKVIRDVINTYIYRWVKKPLRGIKPLWSY
jgi:hypothetical protein